MGSRPIDVQAAQKRDMRAWQLCLLSASRRAPGTVKGFVFTCSCADPFYAACSVYPAFEASITCERAFACMAKQFACFCSLLCILVQLCCAIRIQPCYRKHQVVAAAFLALPQVGAAAFAVIAKIMLSRSLLLLWPGLRCLFGHA